jgi:hypothetical protein
MKNLGLKNASPFRLAAGAALFGLVWAATFTPAPAAAQGTAEQQQACTPDVFRLCNEFIPDVAKITACMVRKRALASPACRAATATPHVKKRTVHHHQT